MEKNDGDFLYHTSCSSCGSSDANAVYDDGTSYCFSCETYKSNVVIDNEDYLRPKKNKKRMDMNSKLSIGRHYRLKDRAITQETCEHYGVTVLTKDKKIARHVYPYFRQDNHVGNKMRNTAEEGPKFLPSEGTMKGVDLFGQHLFPPGSAKYITVTEGELDAMSVYQMTGSKFPVVSLINGSSGAVRDFKRHLEYLESFNTVYICFDNDGPGNKAAKKAASILSPGKAKIVHLDPELNDPNGYLVAGEYEKFQKTWWNAERYEPSGFVSGEELVQRIKEEPQQESIPYPWEGLNDVTYGIRKKETALITAPQKVGKSLFTKEIVYSLLNSSPDIKVGLISYEESAESAGKALMSIEANVPFHLPDSEYSQEDFEQASSVLTDGRLIIYDHQGDRSLESAIMRIRYLAKGYDCDYIVLDNLSLMTSDHANDERKLLDAITTQLVTLKNELDVGLIIVAHLNRDGKVFGSSAPERFCNMHIQLSRDKTNSSKKLRNTTFVTVMDNRFCGRTGPACALEYDEDTGRMLEVEVEDELIYNEED